MRWNSVATWLVISAIAAGLAVPMFWAEMWLTQVTKQTWLNYWLFAPGKWIDDLLVRIHLISPPMTGGHFPDLRFLLFFPIPLNIAILSCLLYMFYQRLTKRAQQRESA
jgi:hypothetical protein